MELLRSGSLWNTQPEEIRRDSSFKLLSKTNFSELLSLELIIKEGATPCLKQGNWDPFREPDLGGELAGEHLEVEPWPI